MRVSKVLNNNVLISTDANQREVVVMGRGIGFQMKIGMEIDAKKIEKVFTLASSDTAIDARYHELLYPSYFKLQRCWLRSFTPIT